MSKTKSRTLLSHISIQLNYIVSKVQQKRENDLNRVVVYVYIYTYYCTHALRLYFCINVCLYVN